jgi:UDP-3-O-[3-hydroxymyristoyl] glucosamine N-acyltransferase
MTRSVQEIADFVQARLLGDGTVRLKGISSIGSASAGDLVFVENETTLTAAIASRASAVIAPVSAGKLANSKPLLLHAQPRLAFARAARLLGATTDRKAGIHPSAIVHPSAQLAAGVIIDERVVITEGVRIGDRTWIGSSCVIGAHAVIGEGCELYPNVTVYPGVRLGNRVIVHSGTVLGSDGFGYVRDQTTGRYEKFPQIGGLEIEDDVEIGANSTIDRGALDLTRIGRGTKIDNLVHVGHNVQVGEDVVIAAQTGLSGSAVIENNVIMGGQVGIADHVRIEAGAVLGAQSGIPSKKIIRGKGVIFWGTPARPIREYLKELAVLARLAKNQ